MWGLGLFIWKENKQVESGKNTSTTKHAEKKALPNLF
jgi:hypothetical protein